MVGWYWLGPGGRFPDSRERLPGSPCVGSTAGLEWFAVDCTSCYAPCLHPPTVRTCAIALAALLAAGCATLSEEDCHAGDWYRIGFADGRSGASSERLSKHMRSCRQRLGNNLLSDEQRNRIESVARDLESQRWRAEVEYRRLKSGLRAL